MRSGNRSKSRSRTFSSIGHTLHNSGHPVLQEAAGRYRALSPLSAAWRQSIDPPLCRHAHPVSREGDVLAVHAESPVWANMLRHNEQSIVAALQKAGLGDIRRLRIRIAPPAGSPGPLPDNQPADESQQKFRRFFAQLRKALD